MTKKGLQIGLLLFGMFFGAGNLIFPPSLGFQSATMFGPAILGFLLSGIGMPVIALIIGTFNSGGFRAEMSRKLSPFFSLLILSLIYLSIGPLMAIPRTAATSFSIGVLPITGDGTLPLAIFTSLYFAFGWWLAITPSKLLARLGKVLTPIFVLLIVVLTIAGLCTYTNTTLPAPLGKYAEASLGTGFIEGYNTMDTLASFAFCIIALNEMRRLSFRSAREHYFCIWMAGLAVTLLMGALYLGLALLGNHFPIAPEIYSNAHINLGAYVLSETSLHLFGPAGMYFLAVMITLTCFTTTVGLIAAVAEFFYGEFPFMSYQKYVTAISLVSFLLANLGLNEIIKVSLPLLLFLYPIAITIVLMTILNKFVKLSRTGMRLAAFAAALVSLLDILRQFAGLSFAASITGSLPLHESGLAWLLPVIICLALSLLLPDKISGEDTLNA